MTSFPVPILLEWVWLGLLLAVCGALLQSLTVRDVAQGVADITGDVKEDIKYCLYCSGCS